MRTLRVEASRGYCGCKHASMQRNRHMRSSRHRRNRYKIMSRLIKNVLIGTIMSLIILLITTVITFVIATAMNDNKSNDMISKDPFVHNVLAATVSNEEIVPIINLVDTSVQSSALGISNAVMIADRSSMEPVSDTIAEPLVEELDNDAILAANIGSTTISMNNATLSRYDLPDVYYPGIDFSSFQPYMDYRCITDKSSPAYKVSRSDLSYTDEFGMRRFQTTSDQFTIDGQDDYVIALGTFYKEKGTAGSRYLIVTTTGMYTAITGDEKSDAHTDARHMFSLHVDGSCAGIVEWIVDQKNLEKTMRRAGTITAGPIEALKGQIIHIYGIE